MRKTERPIALILGFTHPTYVVENFLEQMSGGLLALNYQPHVVYCDQDLAPQVKDLDASRVELVLSLGGLPLQLTMNEKPIFEVFSCPFILYLIDNILYEFNNPSTVRQFFDAAVEHPNLHLAVSEGSYAGMLTEVWRARGCAKAVHFMPMAGFFEATPVAPDKKDAIVVIGNLSSLPAVGAEAGSSFDETVAANCPDGTSDKQVSDIISRVTSKGFKGNVAKEILAALDLSASSLLDPAVLRLATAVDRALRLMSRYNKVDSLRGLPVEFYGSGWKEAFPNHEGFTFHDPIAHPDVPKILGRYKVTLNFDPGFEDGVHDRVISALAQGTQVVTNENASLKTLPGADERVHTFAYADSDIRDVASRALQSPVTNDAVDYRKTLIVNHGWTERFFSLLSG